MPTPKWANWADPADEHFFRVSDFLFHRIGGSRENPRERGIVCKFFPDFTVIGPNREQISNPRPAIDRHRWPVAPGTSKTVAGADGLLASQPRKVLPNILPVAGATSGDAHVFRLYALTPAETRL